MNLSLVIFDIDEEKRLEENADPNLFIIKFNRYSVVKDLVEQMTFLYRDKHFLKEIRKTKKNVTMLWIDYKT